MQEITNQMWSSINFLANVEREVGKYLSRRVSIVVVLATQEVDDEMAKTQHGYQIILNHQLLLYHLKIHQ